MHKILFSRQNATRKKEFLIMTSLVEETGESHKPLLKIKKRALYKEGITHIHSIGAIEQELVSQKDLPFHILQGKIIENALEYPYILEPTLEMQIETAILQKDWDLVHNLFEEGLQLIRALPSTTLENHPNPDKYKEYFGIDPDKNAVFLNFGFTDITAGNIILNNSKPILLDCEWVVPFPIEREFVELRYFWNLVTTFSPLWELFKNQVNVLYDKQLYKFVPGKWFECIGSPTEQSFYRCFEKEKNFQNYVLSYFQDVVPKTLVLEPYIATNTEVIQAGQLLQENLAYQNELNRLKNELIIIKKSKWWKLVTFIKDPVKALKRLRQKITGSSASS